MAYAWYLTCLLWHVRSFSPYNFLKFSEFLWFLFYTVWKTSCYIFDLGKDRFFTVYVCFRLKKPYSVIFHTNCLINISPYLRALANLGKKIVCVSKLGLFEGKLFWVVQYDLLPNLPSPTFPYLPLPSLPYLPLPSPSSNLHIGRKTNAIFITIMNI